MNDQEIYIFFFRIASIDNESFTIRVENMAFKYLSVEEN